MSLLKFINFPPLGNEYGSLVALEAEKDIPFLIKRVYYIFATKSGKARGFHAHRNLKQVVICVAGKCRVVLDDGQQQQETWLDTPTKGLIIDSLVWREMHDFSENYVLLVLVEKHYNKTDYVRNYNDFLEHL